MAISRIDSAFKKVYKRLPNYQNSRDINLATALTWTLGSMQVNLTKNDPDFHLEYGYLFSEDLKDSLKNDKNMIYTNFSELDLKKLNIIIDNLSKYDTMSFKEEIMQASACINALRRIGGEREVRDAFDTICPGYTKCYFVAENFFYNTYREYENLLNNADELE